MKTWITRRDLIVPAIAACLVAAVAVGKLKASDHQQTPLTELTPRYDITDMFAFTSSTPGRVALVMISSSPLTPAQTPSHAFADVSDAIYQIKVDNTGDAVEDLVFQVSFTGPAGAQVVTVRGPVTPNETGTTNTLLATGGVVTGPINTNLGTPATMQVFAGPRNDPFFIDLEQFFRIIPDRRPVTGPLSVLRPPASTFRPAKEAKDFLRGINDMAIVIELPAKMLSADGASLGKFGVRGTTSRARGT